MRVVTEQIEKEIKTKIGGRKRNHHETISPKKLNEMHEDPDETHQIEEDAFMSDDGDCVKASKRIKIDEVSYYTMCPDNIDARSIDVNQSKRSQYAKTTNKRDLAHKKLDATAEPN